MQFPTETPPDIHPINAWKVTKGPSHGNSYLGLVIRDNDTWEAVTQRLPIAMEEGKCYAFNVDLSRSDFYISGSKMTQSLENYTNPAVLRIHGGTGVCGRQEQLGESTTVTNDEWRTYEFKFEPERTVNYLIVDDLIVIPDPVATEKIKGLEKENYSIGETIPIHNIYFAMDSASVKRTSIGAIEQLVEFMKRNQSIVIEVGGHTNTAPPTSYCDELSSRRAKEVAKLLAARGVPAKRRRYKGYGKRRPLATNDLKDFAARSKNQRVEVKILKTDFSGTD